MWGFAMAQRLLTEARSTLFLTHGRDQAKTDPVVMLRDWSAALRKGLKAAGVPATDELDIDLAFYGDLWKPRERVDRGRKPASELQKDIAQDVLPPHRQRERGFWDTLDDVIRGGD